jgi:hypothetical protein
MASKLLLDIKLSVQSTSSSLCPKGHRVAARPSLAGSFVFSKGSACHLRSPMDKEGIEFHIQADDYFGTLATRLSLLAQDLRTGNSTKEEIARAITAKSDELAFLQKTYRIERQI